MSCYHRENPLWSVTAKFTTTKHILEKLRIWFLVLNFLMCMFVVVSCLFLKGLHVYCFVFKSNKHLDLLMEKETATNVQSHQQLSLEDRLMS